MLLFLFLRLQLHIFCILWHCQPGHWSSVHFLKLFYFCSTSILVDIFSLYRFNDLILFWTHFLNFHFRYIFLILKSIYFYSLFLLYIYAFINVLFKNEREKEKVCYVYENEETQAVCVNIIWSKIIFLWRFTGLHLFIGVL